MKYDFMTKLERSGMDAIAVDIPQNGVWPGKPKEGFSLIPMWVADMNFMTAPSITKAIIGRASHPAFGYFEPRDAYYDAIIRWQKELHGVTGLRKEHIGYENGVLGGLASVLNALTVPGEPVLLHSPTYIGFTKCLEKNGRKIVLSPLAKDAEGIWRMDYEDMEKKLRENRIHLAVFCSPHNPSGRVWEEEEVKQAMEIYRRNDVTVVSDEIWCDILLNGHRHIPVQSIDEDARMRTIALYAPSKTFNLAGLVGSYHIIYERSLRERIERYAESTCYNEMNVLSQHALIGAYSDEGREWLYELREVLSGNINFACDFIAEHFDGVSVSKPQGTYMLFLDLEKYLEKTGRTLDEVLRSGWDVGVAWQDGRPFHGSTCIRMNLALPEAWVREAFDRLKNYVLI